MAEDSGTTTGLVANARPGDNESRNALITHYVEKLQEHAGKMLPGFKELHARGGYVDVAVREAAIRLMKYLDTHACCNSWQFRTIARNEVRRALAKLVERIRKRYHNEVPFSVDEITDERRNPPAAVEDTVVSVPEQAARREVLELIPTLPHPLNEIALAYWIDGATQEEIANGLGITDRTVRSRLYEIKLILYSKLRKGWEEGS